MKILCCICVMTMLCGLCYAEEEVLDANSYRISDKIEFCSSYLSSLVVKLCDKVFKVVKRDTSAFLDKLTPKDLQEHLSRQRVLSSQHWRRVRRQIASECCDQPCTIGNLILYCPPNAKLVVEDPDIFDAIP